MYLEIIADLAQKLADALKELRVSNEIAAQHERQRDEAMAQRDAAISALANINADKS